MGGTDLIVDLTMCLQVGGTLMELVTIPEADAVYHQVVVQMVRVYMGGHQYLEVREFPLGQFQADGVGLLRCQGVLLTEGLDEVVVLPPVRFLKSLLGELHFREGRLGGTVPTAHQSLSFPQRLFLLLGVLQYAAQSTSAATTIFDCGEGCHLRSPPAAAGGAVR